MTPPAATSPTLPAKAVSKPEIQYQVYSLPKATVYSLRIPSQGFVVEPAIADGVMGVTEFAQQHAAIAAINGGFFDPNNRKTTSFIRIKGELVADPNQNERLVSNPNLSPYLDKILNRSEFRTYQCGQVRKYAIAAYRDPIPTGCQLTDALGAGPRLLPKDTSEQEGFVAYANGTVIRDSLGSFQPNSRSAIGITTDGSILLVMVAQKPGVTDGSGMSFADLAAFLKKQGAEQAMNLDGGTSSALYYQNKTIYGKLDQAEKPIGRPVKSVLLVRED